MASYRFYWRGRDNHIAGAENRDCEDDQGALELAQTLRPGSPVEVWQAARFVGRVDPPPEPSAEDADVSSRGDRSPAWP